MCLYINKEQKVQTAEKNIPVYKRLNSNGKSVVRDYRYYNFLSNKKVQFDIQRLSYSNLICIERGYHSRMLNNSESKTHLFIIPKNAEFYTGVENDSDNNAKNNGYASNTIIYIGKNNVFNRWIGEVFYGVKFQSVKEMKYYGW